MQRLAQGPRHRPRLAGDGTGQQFGRERCGHKSVSAESRQHEQARKTSTTDKKTKKKGGKKSADKKMDEKK